MTLFGSGARRGTVTAIGCDRETHRRLVDMGLLRAAYTVKARRRSAVLVDFGNFAATVGVKLADKISVLER